MSQNQSNPEKGEKFNHVHSEIGVDLQKDPVEFLSNGINIS